MQSSEKARKKLAEFVNVYFDTLCYQEFMSKSITDKGDKTMPAENCGTQVQAKEGQVNQELNNAENAASRVVARMDELEKRLFEVLHATEPPPPTLNKEAQAEAALVPLASRIRDHYRLLQNLGTRVGEMLERLEIR